MREALIKRAETAGIELCAAQAEQLVAYHGMLMRANAQFNLTRVSEDSAEAIDRNYLDCILPTLRLKDMRLSSAIDVGSGAGFPGIPLSICMPNTHFVLLDALGKRVAFLRSVIDELHLNAEAIHMRAEDAARQAALREQFDLATARAVAPLRVLCEYLLPFLRVGGTMLAMKGPGLEAELADAQGALHLLGGSAPQVECVHIPGRDWTHTLAWIGKTAPTPDKYPRRAGKPEKSPL